jgi:hypothetical protein
MGRGLSEQQKAVLVYLSERHKISMEVVPKHWLLIDLYGLSGTKNPQSNGYHLFTETPRDRQIYAIARASFQRTIRRLLRRGLIEYRKGKSGMITHSKGDEIETSAIQAQGYALTSAGLSVTNSGDMAQ